MTNPRTPMGDVKNETSRQTNAELVVQLRSIVDRQGEVAVVLVQRELFNRAIGRIAETLRRPDTRMEDAALVDAGIDPPQSPNPEHVEGDVSVGEMEVVAFDGVAKRKLDGLIERGWKISGYSLCKDGDHGLITTGGFVGWFSVAERNDTAARADLEQAQSRIQRAERERDEVLSDFHTTALALGAAEAQLEEARKVLKDALHFISDIDNSHKTVGSIRALLASLGEKQE